MPGRGGHWSAQQLTEFLSLVSAFTDEASAVRGAVERAAEAVDAEVGAVLRSGEVVAAVGFPPGQVPTPALRAVAEGRGRRLEVAGAGHCQAVVVPMEDASPGQMVVARSGEDDFEPDEITLLRAMARVLVLSLKALRTLGTERALRERSERQAAENAELLASLQERQRLLERLSRIQRSISHRAALQDVLDAVVAAAEELLGDEVAGLRLVDPDDPTTTTLVSSRGVADDLLARVRRARLGEGAGGRAIAEHRLVVVDGDASTPEAAPDFAAARIQAAMAAPVHQDGRVVGSLTVASRRPGRAYSRAEQEALLAFAEHASLALTDAKTLDDLHQASHDALTGLPNRALFLEHLANALAAPREDGRALAVLFVDLDRFKTVNDSLGHSAGDQLLVAVAGRLRACLRAPAVPARIGGDEFAVLLEADDAGAGARVAERVIAALREPFGLSGREVFANASVGIAVSASGGEEPGELLRDADTAMYCAKDQGRGRYAVFEPSMRAEALERLELEADLRRAIDPSQFALRYQPIVRLDTGRITGVEALVRWAHPVRGLLSPDAFVPMAEETGLIVPIGRWVLREACLQARRWRSLRPEHEALTVSVNLSARQLQHHGLHDDVVEALAEARLDPSALVLEVTESAVVDDTETAIARLRGIRALGVRLAMDDFGTGYSSLAYLHSFPLDILKIDKSFVGRLGDSARDVALLRAIAQLGHVLSLRTIAEGVEDEEQAELLRDLGCHQGQGYFFGKPMGTAEVEALLAQASTPLAARARRRAAGRHPGLLRKPAARALPPARGRRRAGSA